MPVRMSDHSILSKLSLAMIWETVQSLYSFYTCDIDGFILEFSEPISLIAQC